MRFCFALIRSRHTTPWHNCMHRVTQLHRHRLPCTHTHSPHLQLFFCCSSLAHIAPLPILLVAQSCRQGMPQTPQSPSSLFLHRGPRRAPEYRSDTSTTTTTTSHSDMPAPRSGDRSYASDVDAAEALRDVKLRLRAAKEDSEHYRSLYRRADATFQTHRNDLEGLMASEREGRLQRQLELREALQQALTDSQGILAKIEQLRREQEAAVRDGLESARAEHTEHMSRLQDVMTSLKEEYEQVSQHSRHALAAQEEEEYALERALRLQVALHDELQQIKDLVLKAHARPTSRVSRCATVTMASPLRQRCGEARVASGPERIFLPSGLVDNSPQRRAASPSSHHVLSLLSTVRRQNYLRPRAYEARHGCGGRGDALSFGHPSLVGSECVDDGGGDHRRCASPFARRLRAITDAQLAAEEAELLENDRHTHERYAEAQRPRLAPTCRSPERPFEAPPSCAVHATSSSFPRSSPPSRVQRSPIETDTTPHDMGACDHHRPRLPASPGPYYGKRVNALVRALLDDVRELRQQYEWYQAQLRDPHGDSVEASRQMRRLMRVIDEKVDQVRSLRATQARQTDQLRWCETMEDIHQDNAYSQSLYHRLRAL